MHDAPSISQERHAWTNTQEAAPVFLTGWQKPPIVLFLISTPCTQVPSGQIVGFNAVISFCSLARLWSLISRLLVNHLRIGLLLLPHAAFQGINEAEPSHGTYLLLC